MLTGIFCHGLLSGVNRKKCSKNPLQFHCLQNNFISRRNRTTFESLKNYIFFLLICILSSIPHSVDYRKQTNFKSDKFLSQFHFKGNLENILHWKLERFFCSFIVQYHHSSCSIFPSYLNSFAAVGRKTNKQASVCNRQFQWQDNKCVHCSQCSSIKHILFIHMCGGKR